MTLDDAILHAEISIHAARVGCDLYIFLSLQYFLGFQSTQPEWAATIADYKNNSVKANFNPRSPSGLRQSFDKQYRTEGKFQSTQPEWAATDFKSSVINISTQFQSTQPEWAATALERELLDE